MLQGVDVVRLHSVCHFAQLLAQLVAQLLLLSWLPHLGACSQSRLSVLLSCVQLLWVCNDDQASLLFMGITFTINSGGGSVPEGLCLRVRVEHWGVTA